MTHITTSLLDPFISCCVGRCNDYALQSLDGRYTRMWMDLTYETLFSHLQGSHTNSRSERQISNEVQQGETAQMEFVPRNANRYQTLGTYVINERDQCNFAVFDSDAPTGLLDLAAVQMHLTMYTIPSYLEQSRRGAHLWVFFSEPISPVLVRAWLLPFCPAGVEFYPKQEAASWEHPGSLIRLPLGIHLRSGECYPFVTLVDGHPLPLFSSLVDALGWFGAIERAVISPLMTLSLQRDNGSPPTQQNISFKKRELTAKVEGISTIRDWCLTQDPLAIIGRYVNLDQSSVGCCPFGWHHDDGIDTHPSFIAYRPVSPDICCWYCHVWQQGGSLFDFIRLYYGLEAGELWRLLLAGFQF